MTPESEDPVVILQTAARDHIPVNPTANKTNEGANLTNPGIPEPKDRQSIDNIIEELLSTDWYDEQIVERKIFPSKEGQLGSPERFSNGVSFSSLH